MKAINPLREVLERAAKACDDIWQKYGDDDAATLCAQAIRSLDLSDLEAKLAGKAELSEAHKADATMFKAETLKQHQRAEQAEKRAQESERDVKQYLATFAHWHVNRGDGTDACKACGLDLRDKIHSTTSYEAAKARRMR